MRRLLWWLPRVVGFHRICNWKWLLEIPGLCFSFYLPPNISDRFFIWAPHFISIQIFQIGDEMHNSPMELGRKRVELNVCESFKYFFQGLLRKYLKKKIFVISKIQFHHEGDLSESRYFELFFFNSLRNPTTQKVSFHWDPFFLLQTICVISANFVF